MSAGLSATTDYRLRGLSLNGGGVAITGSLFYDHPTGLYAAASGTGGDTRRFGVQKLAQMANAGYARNLGNGLTVDFGLAHTRVSSNVYSRFSGSYTEAYAGLSTENFSLRLFASPDFLARDLGSLYFDLNGTVDAANAVRLFGHVGVLVPLQGGNPAVLPRARYDLRMGASTQIGGTELNLAWVRSGAGAAFLEPRRQTADALVLGASWFF